MADAWDQFNPSAEADKQAETERLRKEKAQRRKYDKEHDEAFIQRMAGQWVEFDHENHGRVKGMCMDVWRDGFTEKGGLRQFSAIVRERTGMEAVVSLEDTHAQPCEDPVKVREDKRERQTFNAYQQALAETPLHKRKSRREYEKGMRI